MIFMMKRYILPPLIATMSVAQFLMMSTDGAGGSKRIYRGTTQSNFIGRKQNIRSYERKGVGRFSAHDGAETFEIREGATDKGKASISSSVFNLVNNVAGAGILTLSSGVASGTGWVPAIIICVTLAVLSGHCFSMIGEACELTGESNFKGLWKRTIGKKSAYLVDSMIAIMCLSCSVIYSGILGDVFTPLLKQAGFPDQWNGRSSNIIVITSLFLLPLSLVKDLSALAFTSVLGFSSILYTVLFIIIRYLDGSYMLPEGKFLQDGLIMSSE